MEEMQQMHGSSRHQGSMPRDGQDIGSVSGKTLDSLQSQNMDLYASPPQHRVAAQELQNEEYSNEAVPLSGYANGLQSPDEVPLKAHKSRKRTAGRFFMDWVVCTALVVSTAALELVHPRAIYIPLQDLPRYSFPLVDHDTVPIWTVPVYSILGPYIFMVAGVAVRHQQLKKAGYLPYNSLGGEMSRLASTLLTAEFGTGLVTNSVKLMVGRPRPNFAERCWPDGVVLWKTKHPASLNPILAGGVPRCTGEPAVYKEGMKSFPSGHTSWSSAGLTFFTLWLLDYLCPLNPSKRGHAWHNVISYTPMFGAVLVGVSRYTDYMHHWQDITVGYILGAVVAYVMYRIRWPRGWNQCIPLAERSARF